MGYFRDSFKSVVKERVYEKKLDIAGEFEEKERIKLTSAQTKAVADIIKDFNKGKPMKRLLQGDVGSGKTIVALVSSLYIIKSGYQTAFMAPTEILASQHYQRIKKMNSFKGIDIALLTGSTPKKEKNKIAFVHL